MKSRSFRALVTASRSWPAPVWIENDLSVLYHLVGDLLVVVHGDCKKGGDAVADRWAIGAGVTVERHPAKWTDQGAGLRRNTDMVETLPRICFAYIHNNSRGATDCAEKALEKGIPTVIRRINDR